MTDKYKDLVDYFKDRRGTVDWTELPSEFQGVVFAACVDGLVISVAETDSYYMPSADPLNDDRLRAFEAIKRRTLAHLEQYPDHARERIMTEEDKINAHGAALFIAHVSQIEGEDPEVLGKAINTYAEIIWMLGYDRGRTKSGGP